MAMTIKAIHKAKMPGQRKLLNGLVSRKSQMEKYETRMNKKQVKLYTQRRKKKLV